MKKKKQKNKRWVQVYSTTIRNVALKVNFCTNHKTNITSLNGYLIDVKTRIRHDADVSVSISVQDARDIDRMVKVLIARATKRYEDKCAAAASGAKGGLLKIYDSLSASETALLCPPKALAASTRKQALSYFRSFCAAIDASGIAIRQDSVEDIVRLIRDMTESSKKSKGNAATEKTILRHIREIEWQLDRLAEIRPDAPIKPLILPRDRAESVTPEAEQHKYIGADATVLAVAALRQLVENGLALGGILMLLGMARTAEACAPKFGEVVLRDDYAVIAIIWQADGTARVADLKTDSSYRLIILPQIAAEAIRARMAYLRELGYTEEQIRDMPAVSAERDPTTQASPAALRAFLLSILTRAMALDDSYWDAVKIQMSEEPDMDAYGNPSKDITAYIARRSRCTELCNGCGMAPLLVDAMMGHAPPRGDKANWDNYLRQPDNWPVVAQMTERIVYDPDCTINPAFAQTHLAPGVSGRSNQTNIGFTFSADEACTIEITAQTAEIGDNITIETDGEILEKNCAPVDFESSAPPPFLAPVRPRGYYERLLREAGSWDAASFYLAPPPHSGS
jgi:hypothetical protein